MNKTVQNKKTVTFNFKYGINKLMKLLFLLDFKIQSNNLVWLMKNITHSKRYISLNIKIEK